MVKFNVGEKIGSGGFGCVYECKREEDSWPCALKECIDKNNAKRFIREVRMQAPLRHENIVPIIAQNLEDEPPWFVMPLAKYNLREYLSIFHGEEEVWIIREISNGNKTCSYEWHCSS